MSGICTTPRRGCVLAGDQVNWSLTSYQDDGSPVSVFEYTNKATMPLARNAVRKLRTIRHPDVLKFMDAVETDTVIFVMTERVRSLTSVLPTWTSRDVSEREDWLLWGLHRISVGFLFVPFDSSSMEIPGGAGICERFMCLHSWQSACQFLFHLPFW